MIAAAGAWIAHLLGFAWRVFAVIAAAVCVLNALGLLLLSLSARRNRRN